jgi:hypothetical protein
MFFTTGLAARREAVFRARVARRGARRDIRVAVIEVFSIPRRAGFIFLLLFQTHGLRRSTIIRSLGRFFRVFAPRVGKPQGVCGWLPFTRPSPPP